jgi:hypothetical protein
MKIGDMIKIPRGAKSAFNLDDDTGVVVGSVARIDHLPDDWLILVDGAIHTMGHQLRDPCPVINASR